MSKEQFDTDQLDLFGAETELSLGWDAFFVPQQPRKQVLSVPDALIHSLSECGRVDIESIARSCEKEPEDVIAELGNAIYQNPETWNQQPYQGWETADEYLSGNLMRKLNAAEGEKSGRFKRNIKAIKNVLPPMVAAEKIYITIGSPWVPVDVIDDFIVQMLGKIRWRNISVSHDELTGSWEIHNKSACSFSIAATRTYGTKRMDALTILDRTLNMKTVAVYDEVLDPNDPRKTKRVFNKAETLLALEKQKNQKELFESWVWSDPKRRKRLEDIFDEKFGCVRRRSFDGSFLAFPNLSPEIELYPYQKNAVARILFSPNVLLAHDVGAGKTYVMTAAGMELRRMGLSEKNLYVVPNNLTGQWETIFRQMYPQAKLLAVTSKSFTPSKRQQVLKKICEEEFDAVIMAYSCFDEIPLSKKYLYEQKRMQSYQEGKNCATDEKSTGTLRRKQRKTMAELSKLIKTDANEYCGICFDELGVTRLFVDEAHNYKNVPLESKITGALGINLTGSKKCQDMLDKVRCVQKKNGGGGVVFATGTPITNSITDAYAMQTYLQSGELALLELQSFDSWVGMFAEKVTEFEIDVDTSSYRLATRFARFHNLPELTALLASIADFHAVDQSAGIPELDGYTDALVRKTPEFSEYLKEISKRADDVRNRRVKRDEDNMLKITTDGRKAALDMRLVDPNETFLPDCKAMRCAESVYAIYERTRDRRSAQLVFCDTSTPKESFNLYDELKRLLIGFGIPENEIAFVHSATTESARSKLFAQVRSGEVRVLIGSTFKLGLGVNVQDKLAALHHLDVPWRPADMTQREGRILRQGNENESVQIFRYITEGSFDAYSWQLLETKQRFISDLLSGSLKQRSGSDIEGTVLDYAEVKALAVGNPLVKQRVEAANELSRYIALQKKYVETRLSMEQELRDYPKRYAYQRDCLEKCERDAAWYQDYLKSLPQTLTSEEKKAQTQARKELRKELYSAMRDNILSPQERVLCTYHGFDLVLPSGMTRENPYLYLQREGRYRVELGNSETGDLIRIDNVLVVFPQMPQRYRDTLSKLEIRKKELEAELDKEESFTDKIEEYRRKVDELDEELGVKSHEQ